MQEEKAELKAQVYLLEKEKTSLELQLSSREAQEQAYLVQIEHFKSELQEESELVEKLKVNIYFLSLILCIKLDMAHSHNVRCLMSH